MKYREGEVRIPSGCAISAVISREGRLTNGEAIIKSMVPMHERSNGLGGGFAAYGIYPEHKDEFALHIFFDDNTSRRECEAYIKEMFELVLAEDMPVQIIPEITDMPIIKRYFVSPLRSVLQHMQLDEREYTALYHTYKQYDKGRLCFFKRQEYGCVQGGRLSRGCRTLLPA